ncbi:carboxylesterase family protein [Actinospica sp. MGRD01-02]|uniref:Carboxylesterase family protein n=1 Tax=Actinospica acidithermotolerans TaxID=2828514 RepID=A0A941IJB0_9ACTN|nr:carboxylesterase family protein [Actinospica acidithermotolerans]MBR7826963.1 carboxylesterase family protein [Actinospica acidithermotolerans]
MSLRNESTPSDTSTERGAGVPGPAVGRRGLLGGAAGLAAGAVLFDALAPGTASAAASSAPRSSTASGGSDRPLRTESGLVTGIPAAVDGVTVYKGIPYAASTAGPNRWRAPQPAPSWSGVRAADTWGPACPQPVDGIPADQVPPLSEDCLNLNIWRATKSDELRPVFVWIYGGRNSAMWSGQPIYDGSTLASKGVVVVTFNHRVGPFGDLAYPELSAESGHHASGNWGVLDSVAALEWVHRNIAAFGGDPDRVTLAGWSHGSSFTNILMISRLARGLFHRALLSSGVQYTKDPSLGHVAGGYSSLADAEANGTAFASLMGASSLAELRAFTAEEIVAKVFAADAPSEGTSFGNVLDGYVLPMTYTEAMQPGHEIDVPVFTGNSKDENGASPTLTMTVADYESFAATTFGDQAAAFLALYPATTDAEAAAQYCRYCDDEERVSTFLWGTQFRLAARNTSPIYNYWWTQVPPGTDTSNPITPGQDAAELGAYHGSDLYYIFGGLSGTDRPWTARDYAVADTMSSYVANFAATGNPNAPAGHSRSLPTWPELRTNRPLSMELGVEFDPVGAADSAAKYAFLKRYLESQTTAY